MRKAKGVRLAKGIIAVTTAAAAMDSATGSGLMEEYDLMKQPKYRVYISNIDKALKNFEYSSEWADLISALGKLNKVISSNAQYQIIPRRIKISKRLAQCMHPALPSGVHLKALESYDVIFSNIGVERLASELFIYSAGLFPLLGYSAMNVRPALLSIYEKYFVPLGEKLRPALSGFLSGVFPGLESGQDHFERTNQLLDKVCVAVKQECFYTCLWECIVTNASVRLPAITYVVEHYDKKLPCSAQRELMGSSVELMVNGLCSCLNDGVILVQRNTLEFLLLAFPMHEEGLLSEMYATKLVKTALNTILRRDMSLNRRLYAWLLGSDTSMGKHHHEHHHGRNHDQSQPYSPHAYFEQYAKKRLIEGFKMILKESITHSPVDLSPYRILISLLDKAEIGLRILDDVLCEIIRAISLCNGNLEVQKSANLLFSTFDPAYIWNYMSRLYGEAAIRAERQQRDASEPIRIDSGPASAVEVCHLTEFLLETLSLEMYNETTRVHLPKFLLKLICLLTMYVDNMHSVEVAASLRLCVKIVSKIQPMIMSEKVLDLTLGRSASATPSAQEAKESVGLEKSSSDSKIHESSLQVTESPGAFQRSSSSQGLHKKGSGGSGKYGKKNKKSKSYTKLTELSTSSSREGSIKGSKTKINRSELELAAISGASSTPNLKNGLTGTPVNGTPVIDDRSAEQKRFSCSSTSSNSSTSSSGSYGVRNCNSSRSDSGGSSTEEASIAGSEIVIKIQSSDPAVAQLPDCPILDRCIRQYVAFYELYVCRKLLATAAASDASCSSGQVSLQENIFLTNTTNPTAVGSGQVDQDLVVINTLASELDELFDCLTISAQSSRAKLNAMLAESVKGRTSGIASQSTSSNSSGSSSRAVHSIGHQEYEIAQLIRGNDKLCRVARIPIGESLRNALKLACNVLTEMSSFPSYRNECAGTDRIEEVPGWLKALTVLTVFVSDLDTQLSAAQTLIDMIGLLRTNGRKSSKESASGKTIVLMMPLLKLSHVNCLERHTKVFQVLTTMLWGYLDAARPEARTISQLLYRLHNCLDSRFTESVIIDRLLVPQNLFDDDDDADSHYRELLERKADRGKRPTALQGLWQIPTLAKTELKIDSDGFRKFQLLWKLGRDTYHGNEFEKLLYLVLDSLTLPRNVSIQVKTSNWLREALVRGDIGRILKLLLKTLLNESTKRLSIFCPKRLRGVGLEHDDAGGGGGGMSEWEKELLADADVQLNQACFAVSSEDGQIRYHMDPAAGLGKKRSPIRSIQKKIFGVSIGGSGSSSSGGSGSSKGNSNSAGFGATNNGSGSSSSSQLIVSNYVTTETTGKKGSSASSIATATAGGAVVGTVDDGGQYGKISVIINPLESEQLAIPKGSSAMRNRSNSMGLLAAAADADSGISEPNSLATGSTSVASQLKKDFHRSTSDLDDGNDSETDQHHHLRRSQLVGGHGSRLRNGRLRGVEGRYDNEPIKRYVEDGPIVDFISKSSDRFRNRKTYLISSGNSVGSGGLGDDSLLSGSSYTLTNGIPVSLNSTTTMDEITNDDGSITMTATTTTTTAVTSDNSNKCSSGGEGGDATEAGDATAEAETPPVPRISFTRIKSWRNGNKLYPFHTHFLVYESVFNTKQILYTIETLRNILTNDARFFLCLSVTTSVSSGQIKSLLLRHRRNVFGKGFTEVRDDSEHQHLYRGCMYLEVILTVLLYYTRSYQTDCKDGKGQMPSRDDFNTNAKIQLECIELMTTIFSELLAVLKDVGKNLANYVADLLEKCKVQKIVLYCLASSVNYFSAPGGYTCYADEVLRYSDPESTRQNAEAYQIELLRLLLAVVKLEHEIAQQRADDKSEGSKSGGASGVGSAGVGAAASSSSSPTKVAPETKRTYRYIPNQLIAQQPMFLSTILSALACERLQHVHKNWTDMVTACLTCLPPSSLTNIVISVIHQLCSNLDRVTKRERILVQSIDYIVSQLEAITVLAHYCLLDSSQQLSLASMFNASSANGVGLASSGNQSGQIINNIVNVFLSYSSSLLSGGINQQVKKGHQEVAKTAILSHLPRIIITIATLWETSISDFRRVKHQLLEFLSPISMHYGTNFLTAIAVAWFERSSPGGLEAGSSSSGGESADMDFFDIMAKALPQASENQLLLVKLITGIRIMSVDSFIQTMHQVIKSPPPIYQPPFGLNLEVSALELLYFFLISGVSPAQYTDCWSSLYALLKDCLTLQITAQFVALSILNEFVQRCPTMPFSDKKDLRDLHDVTSRLVEAVSNVAGSCLEQTTWLRRNLSVKEEFSSIESTGKDGLLMPSSQHYSIQAQSILAAILATLLDVAFSSQEKDKVTTIVTGVMYNIVPYLKTHTAKNIPTFHACSKLLASLSTYQYIRKAWRKDALDLLLDPAFFQMDSRCMPYWKTILDSLMTCDNTTFRDLMNRLPMAQTGSLNIFTSKEQEYEQRALLLKRLAFVIFCSEVDQYHKYMPEIQEQLANSLRLPQVVPLIQSAVFLCFRVLLLRMSADHVTSLWPIIIAEMVQVFLSLEQELMTDTEEFRSQSSQHIRMLSGLDTAWVTNTSNGLYSYGHPHWRMVQLETAKLLELGCVLPATILPHFQMYRWAFVSSQNENFHKCGGYDEKTVAFIPHVSRISQLMDLRYTSHSPKTQTTKGSHIMLTCQSINTLQDLYGFFSTLSMRWPSHISYSDTEKDTKQCLEEVEHVLALDFLEKIPLAK
ncbi:protein dopey-1 homolog isoform X1 [Anopheles albimanus]|uniref:protein dopey-1 homolog isoform X1 n=2 Tax=Anopheles albimanus TaxID=7167 RepID=UPI0016401DE6|nr:protein dopey-1 homolog isoform X1 [Anopheles albimanus]